MRKQDSMWTKRSPVNFANRIVDWGSGTKCLPCNDMCTWLNIY